MRKLIKLTCLTGVVAVLAACGGGDGGSDAVQAETNTVPASATASTQAFSQYAGGLAEDDRREPLVISDVVPPESDTTEPAPVAR